MQFHKDGSGFQLSFKGQQVLCHSADRPLIYLGLGQESIDMFRGNFHIKDRLIERIPLTEAEVVQQENGLVLRFLDRCRSVTYELTARQEEGRLRLAGRCDNPRFNRLWLSLCACEAEHIYGLGEQYSAFDLRGRVYPIFTMEQGVGRNKKTEVTFLADQLEGAGGDYWTTYFPQATFVSSEGYFFHLEGHDYAEIDLSEKDAHGIHQWNTQLSAVLDQREDYPALLSSLSDLLGRQPPMPRWAFSGIWLGMQGGSDVVNQRLEQARQAGLSVAAVWIQDWVGKRDTSFGQRLQWDWRWNKQRYPSLQEDIQAAKREGIAYMGYINPYLVQGGVLFEKARQQGFFVKRQDGSDYLLDFGEFDGGMVDLTNPAAFQWYKQVVKEEMLALGFRGWMADFGEYLPCDCVVHSGINPMAAHNEWPTLWARLNDEAVRESGLLGQVPFFTRSGAAHTQRHSPMMFGGDQNVDWSEDDGLPSVVNAALSLSMTGFGMFTFDIGGYTALFHMKRSQELLLRGCEFAAFTPVMRTHEGNRPLVNHQFDTDPETLAFFARFSKIHSLLADYHHGLSQQNSQQGLPVMRPLFFHYPQDPKAYTVMYQYLLGEDILVAPVVEEGAQERRLYLPEDEWVHLWSGKTYPGGFHTVPSPLGQPPVFCRKASQLMPLMERIRKVN